MGKDGRGLGPWIHYGVRGEIENTVFVAHAVRRFYAGPLVNLLQRGGGQAADSLCIDGAREISVARKDLRKESVRSVGRSLCSKGMQITTLLLLPVCCCQV